LWLGRRRVLGARRQLDTDKASNDKMMMRSFVMVLPRGQKASEARHDVVPPNCSPLIEAAELNATALAESLLRPRPAILVQEDRRRSLVRWTSERSFVSQPAAIAGPVD
jgi:hypothetical protein